MLNHECGTTQEGKFDTSTEGTKWDIRLPALSGPYLLSNEINSDGKTRLLPKRQLPDERREEVAFYGDEICAESWLSPSCRYLLPLMCCMLQCCPSTSLFPAHRGNASRHPDSLVIIA